MYAEFNGDRVRPNEVPNAAESKRYCDEIWSVVKEHNREAERLRDIKNGVGNDKHLQEKVAIKVEKVMKQCRKVPNWKVTDRNRVQGHWIKNLSDLHERIAVKTNKILMGGDSLFAWITHGQTVLCQKDPRKGNTVESSPNYMSPTDVEAFNRSNS